MSGNPDAPVAAVFVAVAGAYALLALYPVEIGRRVAGWLRGRQPASLWDLVEIVRRRRLVARGALSFLILATGGLVAGLLAVARERYAPSWPEGILVLVVVAITGLLVLLARLRASGLGRPALPIIADVGMTARARRAIEGPAIAAGIVPPSVMIIGHPRPTVFTLLRGAQPVVCFTTAMVTTLTAQELEAAAAHEVGHIASGALEEGQTIEFLLDALRLLGTTALWLFLLTWPSVLNAFVLGLMLLVGLGALRVLTDPIVEQTGHLPGRVIDAVLMLLSPPLVLANLLAQVLHAVMGQEEDLLADLRAVEFTRHPEALHAALLRISQAPVVGEPMPVSYHNRYFTAEGVLPADFPASGAAIATRLAALERIDPGLALSRPPRQRAATCPDCAQPLVRREVASHYGAPIPVEQCPSCGGIWFDDLELYMTGARDLLAVQPRATTRARAAILACPRCQTPLVRAATLGMPADIAIWECGICKGAWVRPADLVRFGAHRAARRRARATAS